MKVLPDYYFLGTLTLDMINFIFSYSRSHYSPKRDTAYFLDRIIIRYVYMSIYLIYFVLGICEHDRCSSRCQCTRPMYRVAQKEQVIQLLFPLVKRNFSAAKARPTIFWVAKGRSMILRAAVGRPKDPWAASGRQKVILS